MVPGNVHTLPDVLEPSSRAFVVVMAAVTVAAVIGALALWNRVRGHAVLRVLQRVGLVLVCQTTAVGVVFAAVNHANGFFLTWPELWGATGPVAVVIEGDDPAGGQSPDAGAPTPPEPTGSPGPAKTPSSAAPPAGYTLGDGGVARTTIVGSASGVSGELDVWTPAGYDPHHPGGYPVLLVVPGFPGEPAPAVAALGLPTALPAAVAAGRLTASIVVAATTNVDGQNWGCADTPGGPKVGTWLTRDVPALVSRDFAVRAGARWAVLGLSEGAMCAVRLTLTDPAQFADAISLSGSAAPDAPGLSGTAADRHANDLRTLAAKGTSPAVDLLLAGSRQDPGTVPDAEAVQQAAGPGVHVDLELLDRGGHNWGVWQRMVPPALAWLGAHWPGAGPGTGPGAG
jgi:enterochelin esterase-like enzyme